MDNQPIVTARDILPFMLGMIIGIVGGLALGDGRSGVSVGIGTGSAIGMILVIANREWGSDS